MTDKDNREETAMTYSIPLRLTAGEWETLTGGLEAYMDNCLADGDREEGDKVNLIIKQIDKRRVEAGC